MRRPGLVRLVACALALTAAGTAARGAVLDFSAVLNAEVLRVTKGFPGPSDMEVVNVPGDTATLPASATASLTIPDGTADSGGEGRAAVTLNDPFASISGIPQEMNIELLAYAPGPDSWFVSQGSITETRQVVLTAGDTGRINGERVVVSSQFFFDGAIVFWAPGENDDLTDLSALVTVEIVQTVPNAAPVTVLEGAAIVDGDPGGQITVDANGAVAPTSLLSSDLTGQVAGAGAVHVVLIPNLLLSYSYSAVIGQQFELEARVELELAGLPDGRGGAVVLGGPFQSLGPIVDGITGGSLGTDLQTVANNVSASVPAPSSLLPLVAAFAPSCALMGVEMFGLALIAGVLCATRVRRRRLL